MKRREFLSMASAFPCVGLLGTSLVGSGRNFDDDPVFQLTMLKGKSPLLSVTIDYEKFTGRRDPSGVWIGSFVIDGWKRKSVDEDYFVASCRTFASPYLCSMERSMLDRCFRIKVEGLMLRLIYFYQGGRPILVCCLDSDALVRNRPDKSYIRKSWSIKSKDLFKSLIIL